MPHTLHHPCRTTFCPHPVKVPDRFVEAWSWKKMGKKHAASKMEPCLKTAHTPARAALEMQMPDAETQPPNAQLQLRFPKTQMHFHKMQKPFPKPQMLFPRTPKPLRPPSKRRPAPPMRSRPPLRPRPAKS
jgi:hypothetical protein